VQGFAHACGRFRRSTGVCVCVCVCVCVWRSRASPTGGWRQITARLDTHGRGAVPPPPRTCSERPGGLQSPRHECTLMRDRDRVHRRRSYPRHLRPTNRWPQTSRSASRCPQRVLPSWPHALHLYVPQHMLCAHTHLLHFLSALLPLRRRSLGVPTSRLGTPNLPPPHECRSSFVSSESLLTFGARGGTPPPPAAKSMSLNLPRYAPIRCRASAPGPPPLVERKRKRPWQLSALYCSWSLHMAASGARIEDGPRCDWDTAMCLHHQHPP